MLGNIAQSQDEEYKALIREEENPNNEEQVDHLQGFKDKAREISEKVMVNNPLARAPAYNYNEDGTSGHQNIITMWIGLFLGIGFILVSFIFICHLGMITNISQTNERMYLPLG